MTHEMLFSGFGGQGILFMGKQLASTAMAQNLEVSWLPSYGPEMRGGAANCSVIISDSPVGSPIVTKPTILIAMNNPSFLKFEPAVAPGGLLVADSTMVTYKSERTDIDAKYIPSSAIASQNDLPGGSNVILLGYLLKLTSIFDADTFINHLVASIPPTKVSLIENNKKAFALGYNYNA